MDQVMGGNGLQLLAVTNFVLARHSGGFHRLSTCRYSGQIITYENNMAAV